MSEADAMRDAMAQVAEYMAPLIKGFRSVGTPDIEIAKFIIGVGIGFANAHGLDLEAIRAQLNEMLDAAVACGSAGALAHHMVENLDRKPS